MFTAVRLHWYILLRLNKRGSFWMLVGCDGVLNKPLNIWIMIIWSRIDPLRVRRNAFLVQGKKHLWTPICQLSAANTQLLFCDKLCCMFCSSYWDFSFKINGTMSNRGDWSQYEAASAPLFWNWFIFPDWRKSINHKLQLQKFISIICFLTSAKSSMSKA